MRSARQIREAPFLAATVAIAMAVILPWVFAQPAGGQPAAAAQILLR